MPTTPTTAAMPSPADPTAAAVAIHPAALLHDDGITIPLPPRTVRSLLPRQMAALDARRRDLNAKIAAYEAHIATLPRDWSHQRAIFVAMIAGATAMLREADDAKAALLAVWSERSGAVAPRHHDRAE